MSYFVLYFKYLYVSCSGLINSVLEEREREGYFSAIAYF